MFMGLTLQFQSPSAAPTPSGSTTVGPFSAAGQIQPLAEFVNLVSGNNTIAVPTGAIGVVIVPPVAGGIVIKFKTVIGDTGTPIPQASPSPVLFDPANVPADIYLNAASNTVGYTTLTFF